MGLFDFISNRGGGPIERAAKRMLNEHHQQQVRQEALEELVANGSPEAISALIRRLGVNFRDSIKNEQEKRWVSNVLVERFGQASVEPLIGFIRVDQTISAAILVLAKLIDPARLVGVLCEILSGYPPEDHRTISARLQLVDALADYPDERVVPTVLPYTADHDDDVRVKVMELLERRVKDEAHPQYAQTVAGLVGVIDDPEASGRLLRRACEVLIALKADVSGYPQLKDALSEDYRVDEAGRLARR
ncbi:hypothetical protein KKF91_13020 [Myxococcota bacterium]|nr:hypothetical protein [Myxococcota bacterium]MBU1431457.1 hypothetical protein [Myxococcota bacterium]MBU1898551.1 hypothetical protein [Myxococcota bacterium]